MSPQKPPVVVFPSDGITIGDAVKETKLSESTLYRMNRDYRISRRLPNGQLLLSYPALLMIQHRDFDALGRLRQGDCQSPRVAQYFDLAGMMREPDPVA